jgi:hypothetical protein
MSVVSRGCLGGGCHLRGVLVSTVMWSTLQVPADSRQRSAEVAEMDDTPSTCSGESPLRRIGTLLVCLPADMGRPIQRYRRWLAKTHPLISPQRSQRRVRAVLVLLTLTSAADANRKIPSY